MINYFMMKFIISKKNVMLCFDDIDLTVISVKNGYADFGLQIINEWYFSSVCFCIDFF